MILVGIDHAGVDRLDEYTPSRDPRRRVGGRLAAYRQLLVDELKPWIDARYRTRADAAATGIGGSSLGGLAALELGMTRPDVFGRVAALSPSLWWDQRRVLDRALDLDGPARRCRSGSTPARRKGPVSCTTPGC